MASRWTSRAVIRFIEPGSAASCVGCGAPVRFQARVKAKQVICNVYEDARWVRVEHFHHDCYEQAGHPHGAADASQPLRPKQRATASSSAA